METPSLMMEEMGTTSSSSGLPLCSTRVDNNFVDCIDQETEVAYWVFR
jgi:hypothetical protein